MNNQPLVPTFPDIQIDKKEWKFVLLIALGLLVITSFPYIYAAFSAPPDKQFMGFILNVPDHAQYLSWYHAFQTDFLIDNHLTAEENPAIFFNLLWWVLAQVGKVTGLSYPWVYQIMRWASGFAFLVMSYWFISRFFSNIRHRKFTYIFIALGSGLGWVLVVLKYSFLHGELSNPLDIFIAEGNTFLCLLAYPHFLEAAAFILGIFALLFMGETRDQLRWAVFAGIAAFLLGWQHGYDLLIVWLIPMVYAASRWALTRKFPVYWFKAMLITGSISLPPAIYNILLTRLDPTWDEVLAQFSNAGVYTPTPPHLLILIGLPLVMAIFAFIVLFIQGIRNKWSQIWENPALLFLLMWFIAGWALTYIPTDFQVHMINTWQIPVILLASYGFVHWILPVLQKWFPSVQTVPIMSALLIFFISLTNLYLFTWRFVDLHRYNYPYYLHVNEVQALHWLEENTPSEAVILSSMDVGQYIPGISGRRAFLAHWAETLDFYHKQQLVDEFFKPSTTDNARMNTLSQYQVQYILWGPNERSIGSVNPDQLSYLIPVFTSETVNLYQVIPLSNSTHLPITQPSVIKSKGRVHESVGMTHLKGLFSLKTNDGNCLQ